MRKHILVTHNDLDGVAAAILFSFLCMMYGFNYEMFMVDIDEVDATIRRILDENKIAKLYIVDVSPKDQKVINALNDLILSGTDILLFDHHETAAIRFKDYSWATFDSVCGSMQFYDFLINGEGYKIEKYREFVLLVNTYDLYQTDSVYFDDSRRLNMLFTLLGQEKFIERMVDAADCPEKFTSDETEIIDLIQEENQRYINEKIESISDYEFDNISFAVIFADRLINEISEDMRLIGYDEYAFVAVINMSDMKVSLRAIDKDFNVGKFAKNFSERGGGHQLSGGFALDKSDVISFFNNIFEGKSE